VSALVSELLADAAEESRVVGASMAAHLDGELVAAQAGTATCGAGDVGPDTRFRIGSTAKPLTAAALVSVLEEVGLDLGTPVSTVVPEFDQQDMPELTFRHLLRHEDGLDGVLWDGFGDGEDAIAHYAAACSGLGRLFPPGSSWAYSNSAFVLAGRAIECLTEVAFHTAIDQLVLGPAGCTNTSVFEARPPQQSANGHYVSGEATRCAEQPTGRRALAPAGAAAWGTPLELLMWASHLLRPDAVDMLREERISLPPADGDAATHQTLGWKVFDWGGPVCLGHDGGSEGQATFLRFVPELDAGVALTANTTPNAMFLWAEVASWFYGRAGLRPPGRRPQRFDVSTDPDDLGLYEARDAIFEFGGAESALHLRVRTFGASEGPRAPAVALGERTFRTSFPLVDAYGVFSIEHLHDGTRLLHAGPFTARQRTPS
jgi:CubicO group peptidase (beta-lactamase class C family)